VSRRKSPLPFKFQYKAAAICILSDIASFSVAHYVGDHPVSLFNSRFYEEHDPAPGSLVALSMARPTEWCFSWVIESYGGGNTLLESILTGRRARWTNVSYKVLNRQRVAENPEWRWTDAQHAFNKRWENVCYKKGGAYIHRPNSSEFGENYTVTLSVRTMFDGNGYRAAKTFSDYRKLKVADLLAYFKEAEAEHDAYDKAKANQLPKQRT
jgi:hypothetical protein